MPGAVLGAYNVLSTQKLLQLWDLHPKEEGDYEHNTEIHDIKSDCDTSHED